MVSGSEGVEGATCLLWVGVCGEWVREVELEEQPARCSFFFFFGLFVDLIMLFGDNRRLVKIRDFDVLAKFLVCNGYYGLFQTFSLVPFARWYPSFQTSKG